MDPPSSLSSAAAGEPLPPVTVARVPLTRGRPAVGLNVFAIAGAADPTGVTERLAEERYRIAEGLADVVVHRLFSAGIDLESALGLMGEHRATSKIYHAISELDQAIKDIRNAIFDS
jgi:hypothetical protein